MVIICYFFYTFFFSIFFLTPPYAKPLDQSLDSAITDEVPIDQTLLKHGSFLFNFPNNGLLPNGTGPYKTTMNFLGKKTTVTIDKNLTENPDDTKFLLEFAPSFTVKFSPWHTVDLKSMTYETTATEKIMQTSCSLFGSKNDTTIKYLAESSQTTGESEKTETFFITSKGMSFSKLIPIFKGKPYTNTIIENFESTLQISKETISSSFNFSLHLKELLPSLRVSNKEGLTEFSGSYTNTGNYEFIGTTNEKIILAPNIATLSDVTISYNNKKIKELNVAYLKEETISLQATLDLTLPGNKKQSLLIEGSIINGELTTLIGTLKTPAYYNGIEITGIRATLNFVDDTLELAGMATILENIRIEAAIRINNLLDPNTPQVQEKSSSITFIGRAISDEGYKPFAQIPGLNLGPLKNIKLENVEFSFDTNDMLIIEGTCNIFGFETKASLKKAFNFAQKSDAANNELEDSVSTGVDINIDGNGLSINGVLFKASFTQPVKIEQLTSALNGTPLAKFNFPYPKIFVSSEDTYDADYQLLIPKGASIATSINTNSPFFVPVKKLLGGLPAQLGVLMPLFPDTGSPTVSISIALPPSANIPLDSKTKIEQLRFILSVSPINLIASIKGSIFTHLPYQQEPVVFIAGCDFDAQPEALGVTIKGTMLGYWEDVFTIKGLNLGDIALEVGVDFIPVTPFVLPKDFGFRGALDLGGPKIAMGTKISTDGDYVLEGALDGSLNFKHLIHLANKIGVPIPDKVPKNLAEIRDVVAKIATKTTTIGEFVYREGIEFKGSITLFGKTATTDINVNTHGILAEGSLEEIEIDGILKVTGKGLADSETDGPAFRIALTPLEQCIFLNGSINLFGASYESDIYVSPVRAHFSTNYNLFNLVTMTLEGTSQITKGAPDFYIRGEYTNGIDINLSKKDLEKALKYMNSMLSDSGNLIDEVNNLEAAIKERHEHLMKKNKHYASAQRALDSAQKAVDDAEDKVKKLDRRIKKLSKRLHVERIVPHQDSLLSKTNQELDKKLYHSFGNHTIFAQTQKPVLLAKNNIDKTFKKAGKDIKKGFNKTKDFAEDSFHETKKAINKGIDHTDDIINKGIHHTKKAINKGINLTQDIIDQGIDHAQDIIDQGIEHTKDIIDQGVDFIEDSAQLVSDGTEFAALKTAREAAMLSLEAAQTTLVAAKETHKLSDPKIAKMRAEQAGKGIQYGVTQAGLETAKLAIKAALATYPAVKWLTSIHIKEVSISAALSNPLPKFRCVVRAFDKIDAVIEFNSNPEEAFEYLVNQALLLLKDL